MKQTIFLVMLSSLFACPIQNPVGVEVPESNKVSPVYEGETPGANPSIPYAKPDSPSYQKPDSPQNGKEDPAYIGPKPPKQNAPAGTAKAGDFCGGKRGIQCGEGLFCEMPLGDGLSCNASDRGGECVEQPAICTREFRPVCGCDGKTYSNDCSRQAAGVSLASQGACGADTPVGGENPGLGGARAGQTCGGIAGIQCGNGLFCNMTEEDSSTCSTADRAGVCMATTNMLCTREYRPVCGCDGKTYGNDCVRMGAQVARAHVGACTEEDGTPPSGGPTLTPGKPSVSELPIDGVLLSLDITSCSNPWDAKGAPTVTKKKYSNKTLSKIDGFFRGKKIIFEEIGILSPTEPVFTCQACTCGTGNTLVVVAKKKDVKALQRDYGFTSISGNNWIQATPISCGGNPWESLKGSSEVQKLGSYLKTAKTPASQVGFLYSVSGRVTCKSCNCPRGDRVLVKTERTLLKAPVGFTTIR